MHFLDNQLWQVRQHIFAIFGLAQNPGGDIGEQRLFREIEADHVGHVGINGLVIGDAGADGIGHRHATGAIGRHQPGNAKRRFRPEGQRIDIVIVDATVDDIHALRTARGAHVDRIVAHEQIFAFHQLDTHLLREERVLEVGAVVAARREQHDGGIGNAFGRDAAQVVDQHLGVMLHRRHRVHGE